MGSATTTISRDSRHPTGCGIQDRTGEYGTLRRSYADDFAAVDFKPRDRGELMHLNTHGIAGVAVTLHHFVMPDGSRPAGGRAPPV